MFRVLLCLFISFFILGSVQAEDVGIPKLNSRVTDTANILTISQKANIEQRLKALEQSKGSQIAVLIISTSKPESIEGYSIRVVDKWKLGRKGIDDGVLLLIAHDDHKIRIEVGYGLEGAITDLSSGRIIRQFITPEFKKGNFYEGILSGVIQLTNLINGEPLPEPTSNQGNNADASFALPLVIFASLFFPKFLSPLLGRTNAALIVTIVGTAIVWFLFHDVIITGIAFVFLLLSFAETRETFHDGTGGGFGGGGFGGGFGGGGGFSGGGGGFGGGGASGGW